MYTLRRFYVQLASLLLLHSSWWPWAQAKWLCNPVLSCHSCQLAWFACPVGIFIHYSAYQIFPFLALGTVLLLGVLFGRLLCGWVCPFGFLQDALNLIPTKKFKLPEWAGYTKYVVLVAMVFVLPWFFGESSKGVFCWYCPSAALQVTLPYLGELAYNGQEVVISTATTIKLTLLVGILVMVVFFERSFCKLFCPIGAMLAPLNYVSFWIVKIPAPDCLTCAKCDKRCPTNIKPSARIDAGIPANRSGDCIVCHECQPVCPQIDGPIKRKKPRTLKAQAEAAGCPDCGDVPLGPQG